MTELSHTDTKNKHIVVVGSANLDFVVSVENLPTIGETVLGKNFEKVPGGKGLNQATAASQLGGKVSFIGCIGSDPEGEILSSTLKSSGVNCDFLSLSSSSSTGIAMIGVDSDADNSIIVYPGANNELTPKKIVDAKSVLASSKVTLLQLEVPLKSIKSAIELSGGIIILNPAPAGDIPNEVLEKVDVLVPNRIELARLTKTTPSNSLDDIEAAARTLPARNVVVTLGSEGAFLLSKEKTTKIPSPKVDTIDTTGAGDAFCGSLAEGLSKGLTLLDATEVAVVAGALATTKNGAQPSMPNIEEVNLLLEVVKNS